MGSSYINVGEKSVILIDCSNKTPEHIEEVRATLEEARVMITAAPENSVYIITDLTKSRFNPELVNAFSDFTSANTKYVKESILIGLSDYHKVIVTILKKLHKREYTVVDTLEDAQKYLLSVN